MRHASRIRIAALALAALPLLSLAAGSAVLTIADGEVSVLRDTRRFGATEGVRLRADDIVRTTAGTRLARVELDDGTAIDLGPATQLMLQPSAAADRGATLYLLTGWAKLSTLAKPATPVRMAAPRLAATPVAGTAVLYVGKDVAWLFAEAGAAVAMPRGDAPAAPALQLREGDSYVQRGAEPGSVSRRAPPDLLAQLPRAFADSLPRRAARFASVSVEPTQPDDVRYDEVAPWLNAEPALRAGFVPRFTPLAKQARFRSGLIAELSLHQEWRAVLFPPPPPPPPRPKERPVAVLRAPAAASEPAPAAPVAAETRPTPYFRWVPVEEPGTETSLTPAQAAPRGDPR